MFTIRQIKYFVITVEKGSISAAADDMGMTPQAVSKGIGEIEHRLQRPLFIRKASGLKPTQFGYALYRKARETLASINEFENFAQNGLADSREGACLYICSPRFASSNLVNRKIYEFFKRTINIDTTVRYGNADECIESLSLGTADGMITIGSTFLPDFDQTQIASVPVGVLLQKRHRLASKKTISSADLQNYPIYLIPEFNFFYETLVAYIREEANHYQYRDLEMSIMALHRALFIEQGVVLIPFIKGIDKLYPETIVLPFAKRDSINLPMYLVTNKLIKTQFCRAIEVLSGKNTSRSYMVNEVFN